MNITFQPFHLQDLSEIAAMILALYQEEPEGEPMSRAKIERTVRELTEHPDKGRIIVFCVDQNIVGYALLIFYWSNEFGGNILHIDELYVTSAWRNRGIARRFLEYLTGYEPETTRGLQLEVTPSNERVRAYYQRLGFHPTQNTHLFKKLR